MGGFSLLAVLFNRGVSGIAPVADASRFFYLVLLARNFIGLEKIMLII